jgi:hypothetical protein
VLNFLSSKISANAIGRLKRRDNPLFRNILQASPYGSRLCGRKAISSSRKFIKVRNLDDLPEKNIANTRRGKMSEGCRKDRPHERHV